MIENDEEGTACHEFEEGEDNEFECYSRCRMETIRVSHLNFLFLLTMNLFPLEILTVSTFLKKGKKL